MSDSPSRPDIPGYTFGTDEVAASPLTEEEFERLQTTVFFTDDDVEALHEAGDVLEGQIDDILDVWYDFVASNDHLVAYFSTAEGVPIPEYLDAVRSRFAQWIRDTCRAEYDQNWLDYQQEIALRHTQARKNETDDVDAVGHIPLRYMIAFIYPITATIRDFLRAGNHSEEEVDAMYHAWFKAIVLQVTLWSEPYTEEGAF
jgi:hypothetical protein